VGAMVRRKRLACYVIHTLPLTGTVPWYSHFATGLQNICIGFLCWIVYRHVATSDSNKTNRCIWRT